MSSQGFYRTACDHCGLVVEMAHRHRPPNFGDDERPRCSCGRFMTAVMDSNGEPDCWSYVCHNPRHRRGDG